MKEGINIVEKASQRQLIEEGMQGLDLVGYESLMQKNKDQYRALCEQEDSIMVYLQPWWLDAVCGERNWEVQIILSSGRIIAAWPYFKINKFGFSIIKMPLFTPMGGIWMCHPVNQNYINKVGEEIALTEELLKKLPRFSYLNQGFNYQYTNWLGLHWNGYEQYTRYSYVLDDISNLDQVFEGFHKNKRGNIRKSEKLVRVGFDLSAGAFYEFHRQALLKMGKKISYSFSSFKRLHDAAIAQGKGRIIFAIDQKQNIHSALFFVWDARSAYTIISVTAPEFLNSYSLSLLFYEAIKFCSNRVKSFDFEGSMARGVELSYRYFGARQRPFFAISKKTSKLFSLLLLIKNELF